MKLNTPHAVLTPSAAICHGGHYLPSCSLQQSCHGYMMSFSLSTLLTNTEHTTDVQGLFRHMMAHYRNVYMQGRGPSARVSFLSSDINCESLIDLNSTSPVPGTLCRMLPPETDCRVYFHFVT